MVGRAIRQNRRSVRRTKTTLLYFYSSITIGLTIGVVKKSPGHSQEKKTGTIQSQCDTHC